MANWIKVAGIAVSVIGAGVSFAADQINEHKMKEAIREEVQKEFTERFNNENKEEA